ncbi:MAG TPA: hypothetical protein VGE38_11535 [Nocardioides sp.]|uniref:hypothetical protein n=1 Tax=Nocardioides sp. TaxID=35761 RepID=UPI002ED78AF0
MTAVASPLPVAAAAATAPGRRRVVLALARHELRRTLRLRWLLPALALTGLVFEEWRGPQQWNGERYGYWFTIPAVLGVAASLLAAASFHRERTAVAEASPAGEAERCLARLLAAAPLVAVTAAVVAAQAAYIWSIGGLDLGDEPGRTLRAYPTLPELAQPVAVTVLGIAVGAAVGRRVRHRATAMLALVAGWLPVTFTYWAFQAPVVAPFSVLQSQPVDVPLGNGDPVDHPAQWLLSAPNDYQVGWDRLVVSESLAWWHDLWLVGLAVVVLAAAVPRGRRQLVVVGGTLAVGAAVAQFLVYP